MTTSFAAIADSPFKLQYDRRPRLSAETGIVNLERLTRIDLPCPPLRDFIAGAARFIEVNGKQAADVGSPFIAESLTPLEFAAHVRITGVTTHSLYLCASRPMLTILMMRMGMTDITSDAMRALMTTMANATIGATHTDDYVVWNPVVTNAHEHAQLFSEHATLLVTPLHWRRFTAQIVMSIK